MNLENIREGMRVPNYRKMCELLEEKAEDGNSKNAQLQKWNGFFSYQREGNAYIITEIYAVPRTIDDR